MTRILEMVAEERPRERLWNRGAASLKTSELIAIMLRTGMKGKSAVVLGEEILCRYSTLDALCRASALELSKIKGVGMTKAVQLKAAFELAARLSASRRQELPIDTPEDVYQLLGEEMRSLPVETLRVIALNTRHHLIAVKEVTRGTLNETIAHPRDILKVAVEHNAYGVIVAHNHPSGDPAPSNADLEFTQGLKKAAQILQIELFDHIILGTSSEKQPKAYYSFREAGYL